jgi:hypothetical protein
MGSLFGNILKMITPMGSPRIILSRRVNIGLVRAARKKSRSWSVLGA